MYNLDRQGSFWLPCVSTARPRQGDWKNHGGLKPRSGLSLWYQSNRTLALGWMTIPLTWAGQSRWCQQVVCQQWTWTTPWGVKVVATRGSTMSNVAMTRVSVGVGGVMARMAAMAPQWFGWQQRRRRWLAWHLCDMTEGLPDNGNVKAPAVRATDCRQWLLQEMRLRESSNFCYLKQKLQVTTVTAISTRVLSNDRWWYYEMVITIMFLTMNLLPLTPPPFPAQVIPAIVVTAHYYLVVDGPADQVV